MAKLKNAQFEIIGGGFKIFRNAFMKGTKKLAGRVAKGETRDETKGCLFCHSSAGGGDYIFYPQIKLPGFKYGG